jgi:hypothetical protein
VYIAPYQRHQAVSQLQKIRSEFGRQIIKNMQENVHVESLLTMVAIIHLIFPDSQVLQHKQSGQNLDGRHRNERSNAHDDGSRVFESEIYFLFLCTQVWGRFQTVWGRFQTNGLNLVPEYYQMVGLWSQLLTKQSKLSPTSSQGLLPQLRQAPVRR